ncbi:hypothetical protein [Actinacidiphila sp. ITFR-21]|nr:hypothetical protein [Streptomyces sp. ITFR-21]WNI14328.1 hypothetical protein RLT57_01435 [Streptomyces sp. ITFR-21]
MALVDTQQLTGWAVGKPGPTASGPLIPDAPDTPGAPGTAAARG